MNSFNTLGFDKEEQDGMLRMIACTLLLGNVKVDKSNYEEGVKPCSLVKDKTLDSICELLWINPDKLSESCTVIYKKIGEQVIAKPRTPE
jgi:myosin heavy subunit